jgi:hypothetical protein
VSEEAYQFDSPLLGVFVRVHAVVTLDKVEEPVSRMRDEFTRRIREWERVLLQLRAKLRDLEDPVARVSASSANERKPRRKGA